MKVLQDGLEKVVVASLLQRREPCAFHSSGSSKSVTCGICAYYRLCPSVLGNRLSPADVVIDAVFRRAASFHCVWQLRLTLSLSIKFVYQSSYFVYFDIFVYNLVQ